MSVGNPIVAVRFSLFELQRMEAAVVQRNLRTRKQVIDRSEFIRLAVQEKLLHMERGRKSRKRRENRV